MDSMEKKIDSILDKIDGLLDKKISSPPPLSTLWNRFKNSTFSNFVCDVLNIKCCRVSILTISYLSSLLICVFSIICLTVKALNDYASVCFWISFLIFAFSTVLCIVNCVRTKEENRIPTENFEMPEIPA